MHRSDRINAQSVHATCYLDESATDGPTPSTPTAVVGGIALNTSHFRALDKRWNRMINKFNLHPALHVVDFGKYGRFGKRPETERRKILETAARVILECDMYTLAFTLEHAAYRAVFPIDFPKQMSQYALCFLACVLGNQHLAETQGYKHPVALYVDKGNKYRNQVSEVHKTLYDMQARGVRDFRLGSLHFEDDSKVSGLQAADVVCWAVRRRISGQAFFGGFEPLLGILNHPGHNELPIQEDSLREIRDALRLSYPDLEI